MECSRISKRIPSWFKTYLFFFTFITGSFIPAFSQVVFHDLTFNVATDSAVKANKLLLVDFRADWCKPCRDMEQTTFQDSSLASLIATNCIAIKLEVDSASTKQWLRFFQVNQYPTLLLIDPKTNQVELRMIGYKPARILAGDIRFALGITE